MSNLSHSYPLRRPESLLDIAVSRRRTGETLFEVLERELLREAMENCRWRQDRAAKLLWISTRVINYRLANYGWRAKDERMNFAERDRASEVRMNMRPK